MQSESSASCGVATVYSFQSCHPLPSTWGRGGKWVKDDKRLSTLHHLSGGCVHFSICGSIHLIVRFRLASVARGTILSFIYFK